jgi:molybdenum cofactor cytidylyltransferase
VPAEGGIAAVVLAAGASRRFGESNKLLARLEGHTLIECVVTALEAAGVGEIVVVTGWDRSAIEESLRGRQLRFVHNPGWEAGMGASIGVGIAALDTATSAAFIVPADMPLLTPQLITRLIAAFGRTGGERIVFPTTAGGEQRNPVLWPRRHFGALLTLPPETGGKALLQLIAAECLPVAADEAALSDIDTAGELEVARGRSRE